MVKRKNKVKKVRMVSRKEQIKKNNLYLSVSGLIFVLFSVVLFVNNLTDLLDKFGTEYNLNIVIWMGISFSMLWFVWLVINRRNLF